MRFFRLKDEQDRSVLDQIALVSLVGLTVAGSIVFCLWLGHLLDKWIGTRAVFKIVFILLGIAGGAYTAYRQIDRAVDLKPKAVKREKNKDG